MRSVISFILVFLSVAANASLVSKSEAEKIANEFGLTQLSQRVQVEKAIEQGHQRDSGDKEGESFQAYYIFNYPNGGFVIVSGDDRSRPILAYSDTGKFDTDNIPVQLSGLLNYYERQMALLSSGSKAKTLKQSSEKQLVTDSWGQNYPYNSLSPIIDKEKTPAGCVATAMAIIMKYHNWPKQGRGSHKYNTDPNGESLEEMDYSQFSFDYSAMQSGSDDEIGRLVRCAGHSVNTVYGKDESSTFVWVVPNAFRRYFRYSPDCQYIERSHFTDDEWLDFIYTQIDEGLPVIYSGFDTERNGHAFVIDGYKGDLFHCNWGWDGVANGYYSLSVTDDNGIPEYNNRQGMVINIRPDNSGKELSPCWIDYGYLWRETDEDPLLNLNPGTYVYPTVFEQGKPFDFYSKIINVPVDYPCSFGIAVLNENQEIVDVQSAYMTIGEGGYALFCGINYTWNSVRLSNTVHIDMPLPDNYNICPVSRREGSDKWEIIPGTIEAPSSCAFDGRDIGVCEINYTFNNTEGVLGNPDNDNCEFVYSVNTASPDRAIVGSRYSPIFKANGGVANIYLDGVWATNTEDMTRSSIDVTILKPFYEIEVDYIPYSELKTVELKNVTPGMAETRLSDCDHIGRLKMDGVINADDIYFITRSCVSLQELDLSDCTVAESVDKDGIFHSEGFYPVNASFSAETVNNSSYPLSGVFGVRSLKLPTGLCGWEQTLFGRNLISLSVPSGVENNYGNNISDSGRALQDISFQYVYTWLSGDDQNISEVMFPEGVRRYGKLFVPKGTAERFRKTAGWKDFAEIIETDEPYSGEIVDFEGAKYLLLTDCAALISSPLGCPEFIVADEIISGEVKYPVKYIASQAFVRSQLNLVLPKYFEKLDLNVLFNSVNGFTFNKGLKEIVPLSEGKYIVGGALYMKNDAKLDLSSFDDYVLYTEKIDPNFTGVPKDVEVYVPGAVGDRFDKYNFTEMWRYSVDRKNSRIAVVPLIDGLVIDKVTVNGIDIDNDNCIYDFVADGGDIDVTVEYSIYYKHGMSTHYDSAFNRNLPDSELSSIHITAVPEEKIDIYNINGMLIRKQCDKSVLEILPAGVYLIRQGDKTFKKIL